MNKHLYFLMLCGILFTARMNSQITPITGITNFNFDAVAEATTAVANTTNPLDGSFYVMYSVNYGTVYTSGSGLPNNGFIANGNYTFQLQPYTQNNALFLTGGQTDSLILGTPGSYSGISILCFSTEGNGAMDVTLRFTDQTTQVTTGVSLLDWFGTGGNVMLSGFDRCNRNTGTPQMSTSDPKMFRVDVPILCANRNKSLMTVKFQNTTSNPRNVILAMSGAPMPVFSATSTPVSCANGTNGSATITAQGGIPPFTYTWSTTPAQSTYTATNLGVGVYSYTAQDGGLCPVTNTFAVTQSLVAQPSLSLSSNFYTVCAGSPVIMSVSGANTYTWFSNVNTATASANPNTTSTYTVAGITSQNCYRTGSINIAVNPLPVINFTTPAQVCVNNPQITLSATPIGGGYNGQGVSSNVFSPAGAGVGTKTVSYTYTDINGCVGKVTNSIIVNATPVLSFTLSPTSLCANTPSFNMNANPAGGTYTGSGVSGTVFSPSVAGTGTKTVYYEYTDANNCKASVTSSVLVFAVPAVAITTTKKQYCTTTNSLIFNATPSGGTYAGPGINANGAFNPATAGAGNHTITYVYTSIYGCSNTAVFTYTVSDCTGIDEYSASLPVVQIYPNPSAGSFHIKSTQDTELLLVNELGQIVKSLQLNTANNYEITVASLVPGVYFVTGTNPGTGIRKKIIVTR